MVTGPTGFIGRRLAETIHVQGGRVLGLGRMAASRSSGTQIASVLDCMIEADLSDKNPVEIPKGVDTVFHLAGKAHTLTDRLQDERDYFEVNVGGTRKILEAAQRAGVRAFVLFSSVKAVGDPPLGAEWNQIDESLDTFPDTAYGRSKRAAEELVLRGGFVPHAVVLRPCLVYGPDPKGNLQKMVDAVRRGRFPPLPEVGNKRSMVHIDDLIEAAIMAAVHPAAAGKTYIVADNAPFSTRQLFEWICAATSRPVPRWSIPMPALRMLAVAGDWIGRVRRRRFMFDSDALQKLSGSAWYSSAKIQKELGWRPMHSMEDSIVEIVKSARV